MFSVSQTKSFEAAHYITVTDGDEGYKRVHGHSFVVTVTCSAEAPTKDGWVVDLGVLEKSLAEVVALLDHQILNDVEGLEQPTFENIMKWIAARMAERGVPASRIEIARPTLGQSAAYTLG